MGISLPISPYVLSNKQTMAHTCGNAWATEKAHAELRETRTPVLHHISQQETTKVVASKLTGHCPNS